MERIRRSRYKWRLTRPDVQRQLAEGWATAEKPADKLILRRTMGTVRVSPEVLAKCFPPK